MGTALLSSPEREETARGDKGAGLWLRDLRGWF